MLVGHKGQSPNFYCLGRVMPACFAALISSEFKANSLFSKDNFLKFLSVIDDCCRSKNHAIYFI
jgi:hypothetical protein